MRRALLIGMTLSAGLLAAATFAIPNPPRLDVSDLPAKGVKSGDIILIKSATWRSRFVQAMQDEETSFGHAGMLQVGKGGQVNIIHADPRKDPSTGVDGVRVEPLAQVMDRYPIIAVRVLRLAPFDEEMTGNAVETALDIARQGVAFDHDFDMVDHSLIYCTELLLIAYDNARSEVFGAPESFGKYLMPGEILTGTAFAEVR